MTTITETLIISDIKKTESMSCFVTSWLEENNLGIENKMN